MKLDTSPAKLAMLRTKTLYKTQRKVKRYRGVRFLCKKCGDTGYREMVTVVNNMQWPNGPRKRRMNLRRASTSWELRTVCCDCAQGKKLKQIAEIKAGMDPLNGPFFLEDVEYRTVIMP